jgi:hypothetical protein
MSDLVLGHRETEHVTIEVVARGYPHTTDYWDGSWLTTTIAIAAGAWRATYPADLRTEEFERFRDGLKALYDNLVGEALFASMEGWLFLELKGDGLGHIRVEGSAQDRVSGEPQRLEFVLPLINQTYLPALIDQLNDILDRFPVIGERPEPKAKSSTQRRKGRLRRK